MLKLILGRAKSGKTAAVMKAISERVIARQGPTILLIPEQYSHEAETELLRVCGDQLCLYAEVLSFSLLWKRVAAEIGYTQKALDKGGRSLCLVRALDAVGSRLMVYGSARRQVAQQQQLLHAIDECKSACISPEMLSTFAEKQMCSFPLRQNNILAEKINDLSLIYGAYDAISSQSGLDQMDQLSLLANNLSSSHYGTACYYIDGFTDFSALEIQVIKSLLNAGCDITVCLTTEGLTESLAIFEPSRRAALRLMHLAESVGYSPEVQILTPSAGRTPMEILERELFGFSSKTFPANGKIEIHYAPDITTECEAAAAKCLSLVQEKGCRWRDIAVAARNYDTYRAALESIFPHYGIPIYSARKSDLSEKPLITLIRSAYDIITGGWELDDILCYLKTGLTGLSLAERDELENYSFLWSLHGNAWTQAEDWTSHPDGFTGEYTDEVWARLHRINDLRRRIVSPLQVLANTTSAAVTGKEQAISLADFFKALELPTRLEQHAKVLKATNMAQSAAEYTQLWKLIIGALEQAAAILGNTKIETESFGQLFCSMLSSYNIGSIPLSLDRVSAGDMDRMRRRHIRHLIVLGCDNTSLPKVPEQNGFFNDEDMESLRTGGLELGRTAGEKLNSEFSMIYSCLTLPSDSLTMSWCTNAAEDGKAAPSFVVKRAAILFSLVPSESELDLCRSYAPLPAFELAASAISSPSVSPLNDAALAYFSASQTQADKLHKVYDAAHLVRGQLSRNAVRSLYGEIPRLSASRLGKLADCRFAFFLQYGLKVKPRQALEFTPPEYGTFQHEILQNVAEEVMSSGGFSGVTRTQIDELTDKYIARYVHEKLNDFHEKNQRFIYLFYRLCSTVRNVVGDMVEELSRGEFIPLDFELDFGNPENFPSIQLGEGNDKMILSGIADRVDGFIRGESLYLRVVDYKTGKKTFSLSDVWYGMGLQMLLYLFALQQNGKKRYGKEIIPAGVLYVPARDTLLSVDSDMSAEEINCERAKYLKRSGLLLEDPEILKAMENNVPPKYLPVKIGKDGSYSEENLATLEKFDMLSCHIKKTLKELAKELHNGSVAADPWFRGHSSKACDLCDYATICHLDENSDHIRYLVSLKESQVWEKLESEKEKL